MKQNLNDIKYFEYIRQYLDNEMSPLDKKSFEEELEKNLILKDEYNLYLSLIKGLRQNNIDALRQRFKEIDKEFEAKKTILISKKIKYKRYFAVAASIALLISITLFIKSSKNTNQIAEKYWEEDRGLPTLMGESSDIDLDRAMMYYKENKYSIALKKLLLLKTKNNNDTLNYYIGNCEYKLGNFNRAKKSFKEVLKFKKSVFFEKSEYRLAFCFLPTNKKYAIILFEKIKNTQYHLYQKQSKEILKSLQDQ
jgi:hypothetical protein